MKTPFHCRPTARGVDPLIVAAVLVALLLLVAPAPATARSGLRVAPDGATTLISKDVNGERWAIAGNAATGSVTGNVFRPDGGPPQFLSCWELERTGGEVRLHCWGTRTCDGWDDLGEVGLPEDFFTPTASCTADDTGAVRSNERRTAAAPGSGLRRTPDQNTIVISKDVAGQRWAIARDVDTGNVSGNVFSPDGGAAQFLWCEPFGDDGSDGLDCQVAESCSCPPCQDAGWTSLAKVELPDEFFTDRRCADAPAPRPAAEQLVAALEDPTERFGHAVALSGDLAVVSAYGDGRSGGHVYVFERSAGAWQQTAVLTAPDLDYADRFGGVIAASGGTIAVASVNDVRVFERGNATWAESARLDLVSSGSNLRPQISALAVSENRIAAGGQRGFAVSAVGIFERAGTGWKRQALLRPAGIQPGLLFGSSLGIDGETLAIGAKTTGGSVSVGRVELYEHSNVGWTKTATVVASDGRADGFGQDVALAGDVLLVGADRGANGSDPRPRGGAAFVFERSDGAWRETARLDGCATDTGTFGGVVALVNGLAIVGGYDSAGGGAGGDLHVFERTATSWREKGRLAPSDSAPDAIPGGHFYGVSGSTLLAGVASARAAYAFDVGGALEPAVACPAAEPRVELWPGDDWQVAAPEAHGMSSGLLARARDYAFDDPTRHTQGVVVVRDGAIVAEWYAPDRDRDSFAASWSVAKSFAGSLIGIALGEGAIESVDDSMARFVPAWAGTAKEEITLRHVLAMSSGLDWTEDYDVNQSELSDIAYLASVATDQLGYVEQQPLRDPPGTVYYYSSGDTMLLSGVVEAATGIAAGDYAQQMLFGPIGMAPVEWWRDLAGHTLTYCCLDTPSRELARFGLLYARGGRWQDRQVVPADWVRASTSPTAVSNEYGYQWRLDLRFIDGAPADAFMALGFDGQFIYVFPSLDLVVVRNGTYAKDPGPPIADPNLFARYPSAGLGGQRGTIPPSSWDHEAFLKPILESIFDR